MVPPHPGGRPRDEVLPWGRTAGPFRGPKDHFLRSENAPPFEVPGRTSNSNIHRGSSVKGAQKAKPLLALLPVGLRQVLRTFCSLFLPPPASSLVI